MAELTDAEFLMRLASAIANEFSPSDPKCERLRSIAARLERPAVARGEMTVQEASELLRVVAIGFYGLDDKRVAAFQKASMECMKSLWAEIVSENPSHYTIADTIEPA